MQHLIPIFNPNSYILGAMSTFNSNLDAIQSKYESLTLEEIINKNNTQPSMQNRHKRVHFTNKNVEYEKLNQTLDEYIRDAHAPDDDVGSNKYGKFDRKSMRDNMSDDDEVNKRNVIDPEQEILDELEEAAKYVQNAEPEDIDALLVGPQPSTSGYQRNRITFENRTPQAKISQQQSGGGNSRFTWNNRSGITRKNNNWGVQNNRNVDHHSTQPNTSRGGKVVKKGSFTYKLAGRQGVGNGIIGIERAALKRNIAPTPQLNAIQEPIQQVQPININVNVDGLLNGLAQQFHQMRDPAPARPPSPVVFPTQSRLELAADHLLAALQANRLKNGRQLSFNSSQHVYANNRQANVNFNSDFGSVTSNKTLNLRFA